MFDEDERFVSAGMIAEDTDIEYGLRPHKFEEYIGKKVQNWPGDVFAPGADKLSSPVTSMQVKWMEFRAKNIHDFMEKASARVHSVNPDVRFGAYVGAWYSSYYYSGVNWASPKYNARNSFSDY